MSRERQIYSRLTKKYGWEVLFLLPTILIVFGFKLFPTAFSFFMSFTKWRIIGVPSFVGIKNFVYMFQDELFWLTLKNTCIYAAIIVPFLMVFSLGIALVIDSLKRVADFYIAFYCLPITMPLAISAVIFKGGIFFPFGFLNKMLSLLLLPRVNFLSMQLAKFSISSVLIWQNLGFCAIIYLAGLKTIPDTVIEAARIDGANNNQILLHIIWPILKPITFFVAMIATNISFRIFSVVYAMTGGGPANASKPLLQYVYEWGWQDFRMGQASAAAVILYLIVLTVYLIQQRFFGRR